MSGFVIHGYNRRPLRSPIPGVSPMADGQASAAWTLDQALALYQLPLMDLLYRAADLHRQHFDPNQVQISTLCSIKTGACPEDCAYCPQSARYRTGLKAEKLMPLDQVLARAASAKANGATASPRSAGRGR